MEAWTKSRRAANPEDYETWKQGEVSPTLNAFDNATETRATVLAVGVSPGGDDQDIATVQVVGTLQAYPRQIPSTDEIAGGQAALQGSGVRRLTPVECERLQGFPDDWTAGLADSHRYKQMGNAVTVNVAEFLGFLLAEEESRPRNDLLP